MIKLVITGEGATIEAHGSNVQAPSKEIPVKELWFQWFEEYNRVQIGWVNFLKEPPTAAEILARIRNAPYREDVAVSSEEVRILGDAGMLDQSLIAPSYIGHYASHRIIFESAEPPAEASVPTEIPKSEFLKLQQEVIRLQQELLGLRVENQGLRGDVRVAEQNYEHVSNLFGTLQRTIRELLTK